jgi:plasmid maintenance system antidote protein VapI
MEKLIQMLQAGIDSGQTNVTNLARSAECSREHVYKILRGETQITLPLAEKLAFCVGAELQIAEQKKKSRKKSVA